MKDSAKAAGLSTVSKPAGAMAPSTPPDETGERPWTRLRGTVSWHGVSVGPVVDESEIRTLL